MRVRGATTVCQTKYGSSSSVLMGPKYTTHHTHPAKDSGMILPLPNAGGRGVGCQNLSRRLSGLRSWSSSPIVAIDTDARYNTLYSTTTKAKRGGALGQDDGHDQWRTGGFIIHRSQLAGKRNARRLPSAALDLDTASTVGYESSHVLHDSVEPFPSAQSALDQTFQQHVRVPVAERVVPHS